MGVLSASSGDITADANNGLGDRSGAPGGGYGTRPMRTPAPFIVGVPRSGTTLLRLMLDAHPELTIPPETHFVPKLVKLWRREGAGARECADWIVGHPRWGDFGLDEDEPRAR